MRISAEERAKEHFGEKRGHVTIGAFAGKHPTTGTAMVKASCECGREFEAMLSALLDDDRKYCDTRTCPIATKDRQDARGLEATNDKPAEPDSQVSSRRGIKRRGIKRRSVPAKKSKAIIAAAPERSNGLKVAVSTSAPVGRNLASISSVVESLVNIAGEITIEDAAALVEELKRLNEHVNSEALSLFLPSGRSNYQTVLPNYLRVAEAFLAFRIGIE